ncbi:hypothetical protein VN12_15445 [Pirellula sp. SH-Sr6A]|uniref:hypothetical protein n=1 Tax=Pirellula sp. SH-Sr6A TaxID=1632865 RepID=UPI00078DE7D7|nr:hypothetical protein [Pirellula sp. SH-Sr6A]AMV33521.1 hypothetical protein VN12_15445 [Pirellula sp. SH-Sr6A]
MRVSISNALAMLLVFAGGAPVGWTSDSALRKASSWNWPNNAQVLSNLGRFLDASPGEKALPNPSQGNLLNAELESVRGIALLEGIVRAAAERDPSIQTLLTKLNGVVSAETLPDIEKALSSVLANGGIPDWLKADVQLLVCRSCVQNALYDEAIVKLEMLPLDAVSDPSTLLFHLAVCQHHLLQRDACVETLGKLLEREIDLPTRYAITARLMEADIKPLKEDSLDEISRLMNDVERRLAHGRTGKLVRDKQQAIIDKLEKSIDQIEQQMKQQQQQQQQQKQKQQQQNDSSKPMDQSEIAEVKGPGEVDSKDVGNSSGWGNLPPAQRQEALQNMTKDLPSHYRDVIEAYFKRLATNPK